MHRFRSALQVAILLALLSSSLLVANDGLITTIAGVGQGGSMASGIPATAAQITSPAGIWVDPSNNLFIADSGNNRVVRVDAVSGTLSLVAGNGTAASSGDGGQAALASLNVPIAVTLDGAGNLYISELEGHRIRRVNAQTGVITTFAGTGAAGFGGDGGLATSAVLGLPFGLAFDSAGDLYFADMQDNRVRRIDAGTGIITTVAGNGTYAFTADGALAASASLAQPISVAFDLSGGLLISEMQSMRIRRVDPVSGILTTVAGNGSGGFSSNDFTGDGVPATSAGIGFPGTLAVDPNGNIFFADGTGRVRRVDATTGLIITVAGNGTGPHGPEEESESSGTSGGSSGGSTASPCTSTVAGDGGPATSAVLDAPFGVQLASNGNLLVSDAFDCRVRQVDLPSPNAYTNTTIAANLTTIQPGQEVLLTATVSPIGVSGVPTGGVEFLAQMTATPVLLGTAVLNGGVAQLPLNIGSNYGIMAVYSGDGSFNGSGSPILPSFNEIESKLVATVTLSANQNPSPSGAATTFTATVTPPAGTTTAPTGPVLLYDGSTLVTIVNVVNGIAMLPDTFTAAGNHAMTAMYLGDNNYSQVSSAILTETVILTPSSVTLTSSANPSVAGQAVSLIAAASPAAATGTVQFLDGGIALGTATIAAGSATLSLNTLAAGTHSITAVYSGNSTYATSTSAVLAQTVNQAATSVALASSLNPSAFGQSVTFSATVTPATATGTVQFLDGSTVLGTVAVNSGVATLSLSTLSVGAHSITAVYSGDANDSASTSAILTQTVTTSPVVMTMTSSANPATAYQPITLTATVSPATATGTIQFVQYQPPAVGIWGTVTLTNGTATLAVPSLSPGTYNLGANYSGDADFQSLSWGMSLVVKPAPPSSVALSSSLDPATLGQTVTFTAVVSPATATGTMSFMDGSTSLGTVTISGGTAALSVSTLSIGAHLITAAYSGDANDAPGTSTSLLQAINKTVSGVGLTSSANPSTFGQNVTFTASVSPASATGTIQFVDASTLAALGTVTISSGSAALSLSTLAAGMHSIAAVYSGDTNDAGSNSVLLTQTVIKTVTSVALASSLNPSTLGQSITFTAMVTPASATGGVQFLDGSTVLGAVAVSGGSATLSLSTLSAGAHSITAAYSGDANNATSTSAVVAQTVNKLASSVTLASSLDPSPYGQSVTLTAVVSPSPATGSVQFVEGAGQVLGTVNLASGAASLSILAFPVGANSITAVYSGDANYAASTSTAMTQTVNKAATSVTLTSSMNPAAAGQSFILTATVSPASATGTVQLVYNGTVMGTVTISGGSAATSAEMVAGTYSITAVYSGDANYAPSTSAAMSQIVNHVASSVTLTSSVNPSNAGQPVIFTAVVSPGSATGAVQFLDGGTVLSTVTISGARATANIGLPAGTHSITAVYNGDINTSPSTSAVLVQTVSKAASSVTLASSLNPSTFGQSVTLAAAVTPSAATGSIQFLDGSTVLGTVTIASGAAALSLSSLTAGAHSITAAYSGDANDAASASAVLTETVQKAATTTTFTGWGTRALLGQSISFTVAVAPASASGTVNLMKGTTILGTSTLSNGAAAFSISTLPAGSTTIYAQYTGSASYAPSNSATLAVVVLLPCTTVLTTTPNPSVYGAPVTLTLTATPTAATGPVQFVNGTTTLGTANLINGQARLTVSNLPVGANSLTADYSGDATYIGFTSLAVNQTVNQAPTSVALASSKNPVASGQNVTFTATVSPNSATGTVQFLDGSTVLGTATISGGTAALSLSTLSVGAHSIKAVYSGDSDYLTSSSAILTQNVTGAACHVGYTVTSQWNNGFGTAITIKNTGTTAVNGWNLTWTWAGNQKITESWDATYSQTGANAKLTNASYDSAIATGATLTGIGFNASYSGTNTAPTAFYLNGTLCK